MLWVNPTPNSGKHSCIQLISCGSQENTEHNQMGTDLLKLMLFKAFSQSGDFKTA